MLEAKQEPLARWLVPREWRALQGTLIPPPALPHRLINAFLRLHLLMLLYASQCLDVELLMRCVNALQCLDVDLLTLPDA